MPILGIVDSSKRVSTDTGAMFPLQVVTVGASGASSVTFSNIPSTYTHLQVRMFVRSTANGPDFLAGRFNSDNGNVYARHYLSGNGSAASSGSNINTDFWAIDSGIVGTNQLASTFSVGIIDILDYKDTNKFKTVRILTGFDLNGSGTVQLVSNLWRNTNAISSISFLTAANLAQYSQFALYGVKSA